MIGIYGGSFDPIHYGHLRTALEVKEIFALEQLRLVPCYQSPLKNRLASSSYNRLQMLSLAIENEPSLICDARELNRAGRSYTVETLISLRNEMPNQPLLLLMGSDAFAQITQWYQWQTLIDYAHIVVIMRPNTKQPLLPEFFQNRIATTIEQLQNNKAGLCFFQPVTQLDISATLIRNLCKQKRNLRFLLPDKVIDYIQQHHLYQSTENLGI